MQKFKKIYRANYAGENVVTTLRLVGGDWQPETEYVPNSVFATHTTTQAVAIGNGESRLEFDLTHIANHKGGILAENKLQSYGCNAVYRDLNPDFLVAVGDEIIQEIAESGYCNENIVYTNAAALLKYPGKFYLLPQNIHVDSGAQAAYMACFDGHEKVFLIGYDSYDVPGPVNNVYKDTRGYPESTEEQNGEFFSLSLGDVMRTYDDVEFVRVMPTETWWYHYSMAPLPNFRQITYRDFVLEADVG
jgi:hypothetical protein